MPLLCQLISELQALSKGLPLMQTGIFFLVIETDSPSNPSNLHTQAQSEPIRVCCGRARAWSPKHSSKIQPNQSNHTWPTDNK